MKTRQHNQRVIVLEEQNENDIIKFLHKNALLLMRFVINFKSPISQNLQSTLKELNLCYFVGVIESKPTQSEQEKIENLNTDSTKEILGTKSSQNDLDKPKSCANSTKIIHKVRSGEEITHNGSLHILGDITSGAKVSASGSVTIFGDCYGVLEVKGEFLILRKLHSGYIVFDDEKLNADMLAKINANDNLKIIIKNGTNIIIKDIVLG
ncbi:septum site-determining protein MinC [Helicobacter macacae]|uniref:Septum formation inhibitor MinC C-terminal domain-containing protein n=1 Tax=Helicobacter macacae MIT 99-5501 TaxID=1357400 RepID=V8C706_9HELI|nr:septum site-determining protein MinC [Helicobacter macacae]ETD22511.1 hypothetical protein HMPREF2086_01822 [Helicobacter macacae MIT 99-5501]